MYAASMIDRMVLALLIQPITKTFRISDTAIGLLFGLGFGLLYSLVGLPMAHLLDTRRRIPIVAAGVMLWSITTILSGFATSFGMLVVARAGVAMGEAVLPPAAISLIADMFRQKDRATPTTVFTSTGAMMFAGAFVAGGAALALATRIAPGLGIEPWRLTLVLVGIPGVILSLLMITTVREPERDSPGGKTELVSIRQAWDYVLQHRRLYIPLLLAIACWGVVLYGFVAWTTTFLIRGFGMPTAQAGFVFGTLGLCGVAVGALCVPGALRLIRRRYPVAAPILMFAGCCLTSCVAIFMVGVARSPMVATIGIIAVNLFGSGCGVMPAFIIQAVAPSALRARLVATYLFAISLVGGGLGPPLVAAIASGFFTGPRALGSALALVSAVIGTVAVLLLLLARSAYVSAQIRTD
jgi:MFS family permease